ncbi:hypothetical protein [Streptomyces sp. NBC_01304]|uniref:hypothetical protein n=1 Tax=Streptomyces sp. NBC_01304 TaxID=2903818 RepID=UPI002E131C7A|nr:hypothetical protein OG430_42430 [Streptomyces sp. NBC_01304]
MPSVPLGTNGCLAGEAGLPESHDAISQIITGTGPQKQAVPHAPELVSFSGMERRKALPAHLQAAREIAADTGARCSSITKQDT